MGTQSLVSGVSLSAVGRRLTEGSIWWARRDEHELALVFYDDRIATADLRVIGTPKPLDHGPGFDLVVSILAQHNVTVA